MNREFMREKGFYLVLLVTVVIVVAASFMYMNYQNTRSGDIVDLNEPGVGANQDNNDIDFNGITRDEGASSITSNNANTNLGNADNTDETIATTNSGQSSNASNQANSSGTVMEEDDLQVINVPEEDEEDAIATMKPSNKMNDSTKIAWPSKGNIVLPFSMDKTVYFQTLDQYKCNDGILITAKVGAEVVCSYEGKVVDISQDDMHGLTITVDHGNNYKTIYAQLKNPKVSVGDVVTEGQVLGVVADPTRYFTHEGTHVFFKVTKNNTAIDPLSRLK